MHAGNNKDTVIKPIRVAKADEFLNANSKAVNFLFARDARAPFCRTNSAS